MVESSWGEEDTRKRGGVLVVMGVCRVDRGFFSFFRAEFLCSLGFPGVSRGVDWGKLYDGVGNW